MVYNDYSTTERVNLSAKCSKVVKIKQYVLFNKGWFSVRGGINEV